MEITDISTEKSPKAIGPYVQAKVVGSFIFVSGQLGMNPKNGELGSSIEEQTTQAMKNIENIVHAAGSDMSHIVKTTILLSDMSFYPKVNEIYSTFFEKGKYPTRACFAARGLPKNALIEIEATAVVVI